jgi:hypothetical protein
MPATKVSPLSSRGWHGLEQKEPSSNHWDRVKCDRNQPCEMCVLKGRSSNCIYTPKATKRAQQHRFHPVQERVRHLESAIGSLVTDKNWRSCPVLPRRLEKFRPRKAPSGVFKSNRARLTMLEPIIGLSLRMMWVFHYISRITRESTFWRLFLDSSLGVRKKLDSQRYSNPKMPGRLTCWWERIALWLLGNFCILCHQGLLLTVLFLATSTTWISLDVCIAFPYGTSKQDLAD